MNKIFPKAIGLFFLTFHRATLAGNLLTYLRLESDLL